MDEMQEVEKFLLDFTEMYNVVNEDIKSPRATEAITKFGMDYYHIINKNIDLLSILDREFADDSQMYILVLSALFLVTNDIQMLDRAEKLLFLDQLPLGAALRIRGQIAINRFSGNFPAREYSDARELQLHLLRRLERELDMARDWIPYEERNHKLIFLETDTLFVEGHAPSRVVMSMYNILKYELGYDVFVLVDFLRMDMDDMENYWAFPYRAHYSPELDGDFEVEFDGKKVRGFQQVVWGNDFSPILKAADIICEMKPEFIWHIGGDAVFSDLLGKITTLVSMPCNMGYSVSEADILLPVGERGANVENLAAERAYIAEKGQRTYVMKDCFQLDTPRKRYDKSSFDLREEDFAIAIVGNRLDDEIDGAFIQTMEEIARKENRCRFLIIGKYKKDFSSGILKDRVKKLGYQEDLAGVLQMTDLFLNPVRSGGGISAVMALSVGVPVITLPEGDVALNAGDEFVCSSLEEIPNLVWRYCNDPAFCCGKFEECRKRTEELLDANPGEECRKMVAFVSDCARETGPMVTVVLPCYNHEAFVRESIESVLNQTYGNIDLVILENGSTDGSREIIREYEGRAKVIYLDENDINEGRKAFREATQGEYFAIMTSDDLWERDKIQRQMDFLANHPEYDACFTWADLFDQETGGTVEDVTETFRAENRSMGEWLHYFWTEGNCLCCPSVVMKSEVYFRIWERDVSYWQHYDFVGWLRMLYMGYSYYVMPEVLVHMRKHSASITYGEQKGLGKRMENERQSIRIELLESLSDRQFAEAFRQDFQIGRAASHVELLCEKILLLMKEGMNNQDIQPLALDFFYRHYQEPGVQETLKDTYGFPREYFNRVCAQMGVMDISYKSYQRGAEDAKRELLSGNCSVKFDEVFRQLADTFMQNISQYMELIRKDGMTEYQCGDELVKGILEFLRLVDRSRESLPLFFQAFPEKEWRDFRNLCRKGRDIPAVDLLMELVRMKSYFECILALQE